MHHHRKLTFIPWITLVISCLLHGCLDSNYLGYVSDTDADTATSSDSVEGERDTLPDVDFSVCAAKDIVIGLAPLDMLLALDTSFSMDFSPEGELVTKWEAVSGAIKNFVANPAMAGIGVGIQYFPLRKLCNENEYSLPAVPISQLPDAATELSTSLDGQQMADGTPMFPMLQGVIQYTSVWATANPERRAVVILATDGIPDNTCLSSDPGATNTLENVEALAATAAAAEPPVNTFVIGVGTELTALNRISQAGNGEDALLVDLSGGNIEGALLQALETIRLRSACRYDIAAITEDGEQVDPKKVNIVFAEKTREDTLVYVNQEESCELAPRNGWYYDNQLDPSQIILCEETCQQVQSRVGNEIKFVFGCETVVPV